VKAGQNQFLLARIGIDIAYRKYTRQLVWNFSVSTFSSLHVHQADAACRLITAIGVSAWTRSAMPMGPSV